MAKTEIDLKYIKDWFDVIILSLALLAVIFYKGLTSEVAINLILLFITAFLVEKYYIGRFGVLPNILIIYFIMRAEWFVLPNFLQGYIILGLIIGVVTFSAGLKGLSLNKMVYKITYGFYGLKTVLSFYVSYLIVGTITNQLFWVLFLPLLISIWYFGVKRFGNQSPIDLD